MLMLMLMLGTLASFACPLCLVACGRNPRCSDGDHHQAIAAFKQPGGPDTTAGQVTVDAFGVDITASSATSSMASSSTTGGARAAAYTAAAAMSNLACMATADLGRGLPVPVSVPVPRLFDVGNDAQQSETPANTTNTTNTYRTPSTPSTPSTHSTHSTHCNPYTHEIMKIKVERACEPSERAAPVYKKQRTNRGMDGGYWVATEGRRRSKLETPKNKFEYANYSMSSKTNAAAIPLTTATHSNDDMDDTNNTNDTLLRKHKLDNANTYYDNASIGHQDDTATQNHDDISGLMFVSSQVRLHENGMP